MPLPGGPSDKIGNRYERRWAAYLMLDLLAGRADSLEIEIPGDEGTGAEFRVHVGDLPVWYQVKRQRVAGHWSISVLGQERVLQHFLTKLQRGDHCVFASMQGVPDLTELADRARDSDWESFDKDFLKGHQRSRFDSLRTAWGDVVGSEAHRLLCGVRVRTMDEDTLRGVVEDRIAALIDGDSAAAADVLTTYADDLIHRVATADDVWVRLRVRGFRKRAVDKALREAVAATAAHFVDVSKPLLIAGRNLPRTEAETVMQHLEAGRRVLVAGSAGEGKSVVLAQVVAQARERGWPVLALRADRLESADTPRALGLGMGLSESPGNTLAGLVGSGEGLLVIDQLDAVSLASGRKTQQFDVIASVVAQAASHPGIRVLLACRQFDLDNDHRLRGLAAGDTVTVSVALLDETVVAQVLTTVGVDPTGLAQAVRELLRTPLHLAVYVDLINSGAGDLFAVGSLKDLYDRYWDRKKAACTEGRVDQWLAVIDRLCDAMSERQELSIPTPMLDDLDDTVRSMASEGVLVRDENRTGFFHETFFDYAFARRFIGRGHSLVELLTRQGQDLFRRAQVRQVLALERSGDRAQYRKDLRWLLHDNGVRPHLMAAVIAWLSSVTDPKADEWEILRPLVEDRDERRGDRAAKAIRARTAWFPVIDAAGDWARWLGSGDDLLIGRSVWMLSGHSSSHPERVVALLRPYVGVSDSWTGRLREVLAFTTLSVGRPVVDLLLQLIARGDLDDEHWGSRFGIELRQLAGRRPDWATEVIEAVIRRALKSEDARRVDVLDPPPAILARHSAGQEALEVAASGAPGAFVSRLLPLVLEILQLKQRPEWEGSSIQDTVWGRMLRWRTQTDRLTDHVFRGVETALQRLVRDAPEQAAVHLALLRDSRWESAHFLYARALLGNPAALAEEAATWLCEAPDALDLGYSESSHWASRELIAAITPHVTNTTLDRLTHRILNHTPAWEKTAGARRFRGQAQLALLGGIDPARRSAEVDRRLGELQRKLGREDCSAPRPPQGGAVGSPIPEAKARKMSDAQWRRAMERYSLDDRKGMFLGGAHELAQVLEQVAQDDPVRFARLLVGLPSDTHAAYVGAILRGIREADLEPNLVLSACNRAARTAGVGTWVVHLIERRAEADLPDELLAMVARYAVPSRSAGGPDGYPPVDLVERETAARSLGILIARGRDRLDAFAETLGELAADAEPSLRAATVRSLIGVFAVDSARATELFLRAVPPEASDELLGMPDIEAFLSWAVRTRYEDVAAIVARMLASSSAGVVEAGARLLAIASFFRPVLDAYVDTCLAGPVDQRAGAVQVFADNIMVPTWRNRCTAVIATAFDDTDPGVRAAAARCFRLMWDEPSLAPYAVLFEAFAASRALEGHAIEALHALERSTGILPGTALGIGERLIQIHRLPTGHLAPAHTSDARHVARLAIRLYVQSDKADVRRRALDLIDELLSDSSLGIDDEMQMLDR